MILWKMKQNRTENEILMLGINDLLGCSKMKI